MKPKTTTHHLGINIGASSISIVELQKTDGYLKIISHKTLTHHGNPKQIIEEIFKSETPENIVVTGRKFRSLLNITSIPEPEAIELQSKLEIFILQTIRLHQVLKEINNKEIIVID